ncbi:MAG TPA: AbrB/MazE/SpoVT family DNA-binding domain-containing protein [Rhizomicrobium sp.]|jgi:AbrB family looped-hinge helix DNA binding protein
MADQVTLDSTGRVVIPKELRDELHLEAGDKLTVKSDGQGVTLRPVRPEPRMRKKQGIWVFQGGGGPISAEEFDRVLQEQRHERDRQILGLKK